MEKDHRPSRCYFCGESVTDCLQDHHVIPSAIWIEVSEGGDDDDTVVLCANCHIKIHRLLRPLVRYIKRMRKERLEQLKNFKPPDDIKVMDDTISKEG